MARKRKRGVNGEPWMRAENEGWYVKVDGNKVALRDKFGNIIKGEKRRTEAFDAWHKLMAVAGAPVNQDDNQLVIILDLYLQWLKLTATDKTWGEYFRYFKSFKTKWPGLLVKELQPRHLREWWDECFPAWGDSTRNHSVLVFNAALNWARSADGGRIISSNPLEGMTRPPMGHRGHEVLISQEDHDKLLRAASPDLQLILTALWHTGTRPSNIWRATPRHFDEQKGVLLMGYNRGVKRHYDAKNPEHKTQKKTGKVLIVPLTDTVVEICVRLRDELKTLYSDDYEDRPLFRTAKGEPWTAAKLANRVRWHKKRLGLNHLICYGYRHTLCTALVEANVSSAMAAAVAGHDSPNTIVKYYEHARAEVLTATLARVRKQSEAEGKILSNLTQGNEG